MALFYTYVLVVWLCIMGAAFFMGLDWLKMIESGTTILSNIAVGIAAVFGMVKFTEWKKQQIAKDHRDRAASLYEVSFDFFLRLKNCRVGLLEDSMYKEFMQMTEPYSRFDRECRLAKPVISIDEKLISRIHTVFLKIRQKSFSIEDYINKSWNRSYWGSASKLEIENEKANITDSEKDIIKALSSSLSINYFGTDEVGKELTRLQEELFIVLEPYLNYEQK